MSEASDSSMTLAIDCPHCGTECEFDLPIEAKDDADLASQIRVICYSCEEMFQPVGDEIADLDDGDDDGFLDGEAGTGTLDSADAISDEAADDAPADPAIEPETNYVPASAKRKSGGILFLSLSILLLAGAIVATGYWLANSSNPAIKAFVETRMLQIEPARFEASRAQFERKQSELGETLQILVEITNTGGRAATPKDVTLELLNANGEAAFSWIMDTSKTVIAPGNSANYLARMVAPPAEITDIRVLIPNSE